MRTVASLCYVALLVLPACNFAPKYHRPPVETPSTFKEQMPQQAEATNIWKLAHPADRAARSPWWEMFNDPELNALEAQVDASNQNIAAAFANLLSARAIVQETRAQLFPTLAASPDVTRSSQGGRATQFGLTRRSTVSAYSLPFDASWQPDLWGRVRNTLQASKTGAQAAAADLENVRLTAHAEVAADYLQLRGQDALKQLFDETVAAYQESVNLTKVRFETGIASDQDVAQTETLLEIARAQAINVGILRAQLEHALAVLTGKPPAVFSVAVIPLNTNAPPVPEAIPSELLERRPDIAGAERRVAGANAQIGVAKAAYYPNITLSASGGFQSATISSLLEWSSRFWSIGASLTETIFDAGLRRATVQQFRASYENTVAVYRQTVLTAFQQVEDNLSSLRILAQQIQQQESVVTSSQRYLTLAMDRYQLGIDSYLNVITAQTTLFGNRQTLVNLHIQQMTAAVQLIEALGGGWDRAQLSESTSMKSSSSHAGL